MNEIDWSEDARNQLADIWVAETPDDRVSIEGQILKLHADLAKDPLAVGESRSGFTRVVVGAMLVVWFNVVSKVRIIRVTRPRRR